MICNILPTNNSALRPIKDLKAIIALPKMRERLFELCQDLMMKLVD
ncbi:MAG UNVERIFIED_CONTAM: hypothetical protein LVQ98_09335 [Rickettsiaceae bacterium]|jgi:hypothetical protein